MNLIYKNRVKYESDAVLEGIRLYTGSSRYGSPFQGIWALGIFSICSPKTETSTESGRVGQASRNQREAGPGRCDRVDPVRLGLPFPPWATRLLPVLPRKI
jgi:hypothetical protein